MAASAQTRKKSSTATVKTTAAMAQTQTQMPMPMPMSMPMPVPMPMMPMMAPHAAMFMHAAAFAGAGQPSVAEAGAPASFNHPFLMPTMTAMMMNAFGPHVDGLRKQAHEIAGMVGRAESASDGSHHTTHRDGDDDEVDIDRGEVRQQNKSNHNDIHGRRGSRASSSGRVLVKDPSAYQGGHIATHARFEALKGPDRAATVTPGIQSPGAAADVLLAMMTCGSDEDVADDANGKRRSATSDYLGQLSIQCPKKRRTMKKSRARSNLKPLLGSESTVHVTTTTSEVSVKKESVLAAAAQTLPASTARVAKTSTMASGKLKAHRPWRLDEVKALVRGVSHYGRGQWADIKALRADGVSEALVNRSAVDLKDKWRNLLRVAMLPALYKRREVNGVPLEILEQVRVLASSKPTPAAAAESRHGSVNKGQENQGAMAASPSMNAASKAAPSVKVENGATANAKGARRSKHHSPWTFVESKALVDGVEQCGGCRWTIIKKNDDPALERRTAMDLKDKWRNLLQLASLPVQSRRKQETPPEFLERVLELEQRYGNARRKGRKTAKAD